MHLNRLVSRVIGLALLASLAAALLAGSGNYGATEAGAAASISEDSPDAKPLVLRVYFRDLAERDRLATDLGAEETDTRSGYLTVVSDQAEYRSLLARGLRVEIDVQASNEVLAYQKAMRNRESPNTFYGGYYTVEEMQAFLDQKVAAYPNLAEKIDIGDSWCKTHPGVCVQPNSWNGFDLWVLHITNRSIPGPKGVFWYDAGIHSREIATPELAMRFISHLLDNYNTDPDARWIVDYQDIWVMPMLNPDGHHMNESGGNNPTLHRKNADRDDGCSTYDQFGTDINRNFNFQWGCCGGSSSNPCVDTYRGPSAESEEETQFMSAKVRALIPDQRAPNLTDPAPLTTTGTLINMHSNAQLNLYPWGFTSEYAPNRTDLRNIGQHMSAINAYPPGNTYEACQNTECLYVVDGDEKNWAYGELGIPGYSLEVGGSNFFPTYTYTHQTLWPQVRGSLLYHAKIARTPYLLTRGPDAHTVATNPMTVTQGADSQLGGTINYVWNGNVYIQNVAAAEYYINTPPWMGGTAIPMAPVDGSFDSSTEAVQATISTGSLSVGRHVILIRGRGVNDYEGHQSWGPITAAFLDVLPAVATPTGTPPTATRTNTPIPPTNTPTYTPSETPVGPTNTPIGATSTPTPISTTTPCSVTFSDVQPSDYFYEAVRYLACNGVISGYADGTFRPYNNTTRGQLTKIVVLGFGFPIYTPLTPTFTDVPSTHTFYRYIETAAHEGLVSGYSDGTFRPGNDVTRGQLSKIVVEAASWPLVNPPTATFSDVPVGSAFYEYVETAYDHGIISGYADGTFRPGNNATRGQISKIVYQAITTP